MGIQEYQAAAFCGGGGKGAYQIGVIKAMSEVGILQKLKCVSGTSVGALNAALAAVGDAELAEYVWRNFVHKNNMLYNIDRGMR